MPQLSTPIPTDTAVNALCDALSLRQRVQRLHPALRITGRLPANTPLFVTESVSIDRAIRELRELAREPAGRME
jgi:hypothetical protein